MPSWKLLLSTTSVAGAANLGMLRDSRGLAGPCGDKRQIEISLIIEPLCMRDQSLLRRWKRMVNRRLSKEHCMKKKHQLGEHGKLRLTETVSGAG